MRDGILERVAEAALTNPRKVLGAILIVTLAASAVLPFFRITGGHSGMVDDDLPYQRQFVEFQERFGSPNQLIVMIEGGNEGLRRAVADGLMATLPTPPGGEGACAADGGPNLPGCVKDVLARIELDRLTDRALLYVPTDHLERLVKQLGGGGLDLRALRALTGLRDLFARMGDEIERRAGEPLPAGGAEGDAARESMALVARFLREAERRVRAPDAPERPIEEVLFEGRGQGGVDSRGYLSSDDGHIKLAVMRPVSPSDEPADVVPFVRYVEQHARRLAADLGAACAGEPCPEGELRVTLTGLPAIVTDEAKVLERDVVFTGVLTGVGILVVLWIGFRSLAHTLLSLLPLGVTLIWLLAFTQLAFGGFNLVTSAVVPVMLGLSIDAGVHLLERYNESRYKGLEPLAAVRDCLLGVGPGLVTGAMTTAGAFFALGITDFKAFREMGIITGVGLVISLVLTLTMIPALIGLAPAFRGKHAEPPPGLLRHTIAGFVTRRSRPVIVLALALAAASVLAAQTIPWSYDYADLLPESAESTTAMPRLSEETAYSAEVAAVEAASFEEAVELSARLEALPTVERVESVVQYLPQNQENKLALIRRLGPQLTEPVAGGDPEAVDVPAVRESLRDLADAIEDAKFDAARTGHEAEATLLDAPQAALRDLLAALDEVPAAQAQAGLAGLQAQLLTGRDDAVARLRAHLEAAPLTPEDLLARLPTSLRDRLYHEGRFALYAYPQDAVWSEEALGAFVGELRSVQPAATGFPVTHYEIMGEVRQGFRDAALIALAALSLLLLLDFRSLRYTVLSLVPLGIGVAWTWGALSGLGIEYNPGNVIALPLILGIAVDAGVHLLHRFRQEGEADVVAVVEHTGRAIMLSGVTTMVGMGALLLAHHRAMQSFGLVLLIGIGAGLLSALTLLPAVLQRLRRRPDSTPRPG